MTVTYRRNDAVAMIEIDNPPVNAASCALRSGLLAAIEQFEADGDARIAILRCCGRTWIAGADITEFGQRPCPPFLPDVVARIEAMAKPVVAALHGTALGGGLEIALAAHYRIAHAATRMGLPEVNLGIIPGAGGTQRLPRLVGIQPALEMITSGRPIDAAEALRIGLIDRIAQSDLDRAANDFARDLLHDGANPRRVAQVAQTAPDAAMIAQFRAGIGARHPGQVAQMRAVDAISEGLALELDEGLACERRIFAELMDSPQRAALVHMFLAERKVMHLPQLRDAPPRKLDRLGVIGGGTMGAGIAAAGLLAGCHVTLAERDGPAAAKAGQSVAKILQESVRRGKLTAAQCEQALAERFVGADSFAPLADADLIVEAVFEQLEVKRQVFQALDRIARPGAVLATNTSYLDVDRIAAATSRPEDVIGLHFFSPAHVMRLLEVVPAGRTAPDTVATGFALAKRLGKVAVRAGNCDGFIGNRILGRYRAAADAMVLDGASPYQIDRALTGFGFAMGPYAISDLAGLDIGHATRQRKADQRHPRDRVPVFADRLYELGRLGRKSGRGYYIYDSETPNGREDPELAPLLDGIRAQLGLAVQSFTDEQIVARYMAAMLSEAASVLEDGTAARPLDIDVVMVNGYGFPRWRGGPMHWADQHGLHNIMHDIQHFAREDDHFWQAAPLLQRMVAQDQRFADLNEGSEP